MTFPDRPRILPFLSLLKFVLMLIMLGMFINFNVRIAHQSADTKAIATSTNKIVKGQGDILAAIKQVTEDTRITAAQQTAIIICMLQVPVNERTTDLQASCRKQADSASSLSTLSSSARNTPSSSNNASPGVQQPSSSPKSTPNNPSSQPDNVQPLLTVHSPLPLVCIKVGVTTVC